MKMITLYIFRKALHSYCCCRQNYPSILKNYCYARNIIICISNDMNITAFQRTSPSASFSSISRQASNLADHKHHCSVEVEQEPTQNEITGVGTIYETRL